MARLIEFSIPSLRGGLNNSDPAIAIQQDQCTVAMNVEFLRSMLGERRRGTNAITLPASLSGKERISFLFRNVPGTDDTASELFAFGFNTGGASALSKKTTSWTDITINDTVNVAAGFAPYQWCAVSLHGKVFFAFDSNVDRLHVLEAGSSTMRRTGLAEPAAPTSADDGGSGTFSGTRYYRVRYTVQAAGITLLRSEPSDTLTDAPSGTATGITVTKPATISEGETHWELEASINNADFYVIATTAVGTTTVTDMQDYARGYAIDFDLSEDIGDYTLQPSARYLVADDDRLIWGGSWEDSDLSSTIGWSPVGQADGVGNDERAELDTDPYAPLDGLEGGPLTGLSSAVSGEIWATKFSRIYKLVRSGLRTRAYDTVCMSKERGALHGSLVPAVDQSGRPCLYALDPAVGPIRIGSGGIQQCGADIRTTWESVNLDATKTVCSGIFYPATRQVIWSIATDSSNVPNLALVLQTNEQRDAESGLRRGWSLWNGTRAAALAMCLFSDNIEDNTTRSRTLVPFIGVEGSGLLHQTDTGNDDDGTAYAAQIRTKPFTLKSMMQQFGVKSAVLLAKAVTGAKVTMKVIRDFGLETTSEVEDIELDATDLETEVMKLLDNLVGSELRVAQFDFTDTTPAGTRFELNGLAMIESPEQQDA